MRTYSVQRFVREGLYEQVNVMHIRDLPRAESLARAESLRDGVGPVEVWRHYGTSTTLEMVLDRGEVRS